MTEEEVPLTHNEVTGDAHSVVQAGAIHEVNIYHRPEPSPEIPIAVTCEVEAGSYLLPNGWHDAIPLGGGMVRLYVESRVDRAVLLRALRVAVVARRRPGTGTEALHLGTVEVRSYRLDLDANPPRLAGPKFLYTVAAGDPEVFEIEVLCTRHDVEWRFELDWICAGRTGTHVVDLGGHPFRFTGSPEGA
ncbi:hypothetical protein [Lentzea sp. NPDC003310]|uniref:hypothetical protein n=1 Tax=Lentzea sp. NPDC003310 TaxID=3154447 RepID=UPI0033BE7488